MPHAANRSVCLSLSVLTLIGTLLAVAAAADPSPADLAAAGAPGNGIAVQIGASDASFLATATLGGRRLVQGLVTDDASRARLLPGLIASGGHPAATVLTWDGAPALPYADRIVNLLILDRDALGPQAPAKAECERVVVPGGVILERNGGTWAARTVAVPAGHGTWTHFDGGAHGNAVSTDTGITGIRGLQWIDNAREVRWAKTGPHGGEGGNIRIWGRYAVIDARMYPEDKDPKFPRRHYVECRDVNNGVLLRTLPRPANVTAKRWSLVADQGLCFTYLEEGGPLVALALETGTVVHTYPGSEIRP
jgi:hypothetical protein